MRIPGGRMRDTSVAFRKQIDELKHAVRVIELFGSHWYELKPILEALPEVPTRITLSEFTTSVVFTIHWGNTEQEAMAVIVEHLTKALKVDRCTSAMDGGGYERWDFVWRGIPIRLLGKKPRDYDRWAMSDVLAD